MARLICFVKWRIDYTVIQTYKTNQYEFGQKTCLNTQKNIIKRTPLMNKSSFLKEPKRGRRYGTSLLGRDGPVPNGFGTTSPRACSNTKAIPLAIVGRCPGAGWLPAVSKHIGICLSSQ